MKRAIWSLPEGPASPPSKFADLNGAVPLLWQERKTVPFIRGFLKDIKVQCVIDITPGSGVVGQACLLEGFPYLGFARTGAHAAFLQNKLDRDALSIITISGSALYQADMAAHTQEHFADIVDASIGQDEEDEEEDDEEV